MQLNMDVDILDTASLHTLTWYGNCGGAGGRY